MSLRPNKVNPNEFGLPLFRFNAIGAGRLRFAEHLRNVLFARYRPNKRFLALFARKFTFLSRVTQTKIGIRKNPDFSLYLLGFPHFWVRIFCFPSCAEFADGRGRYIV